MAGRERLVVERETTMRTDWWRNLAYEMKPSEENKVGPACMAVVRWAPLPFRYGWGGEERRVNLLMRILTDFQCPPDQRFRVLPSGHPHPRVVLVFLCLCAQGLVQLVLNYQENTAHGNPATNKSVQDNLESIVFIYLFIVL